MKLKDIIKSFNEEMQDYPQLPINRVALGSALRALREDRNLFAKDLQAKMSAGNVGAIESGAIKLSTGGISLGYLTEYLEVLGYELILSYKPKRKK